MRVARQAVSGLIILMALMLSLPTMAQDAVPCTVTADLNVNRRSGPGTDFSLVGVLQAGQSAAANGQTIGADGLVWWQLTDGTWVRSDLVTETGNCGSLPDVFAPPTATLAPSPTAARTLTAAPTTQRDRSAFSIGDEVTVSGGQAVLLIRSEPAADTPVVEATISGVVLTIIDGPEETDGETWWRVRSPSSLEGWVPETVNGQPTLLSPGMSQPAASFGLSVGGEAVVAGEGKVLLIHVEADMDSPIVEATVSGVILEVIGGPEMPEGEVWWQVRSPSGIEGWVPEQIDGEPALLSPEAMLALAPTLTPTPSPSPTPCAGTAAGPFVAVYPRLQERLGCPGQLINTTNFAYQNFSQGRLMWRGMELDDRSVVPPSEGRAVVLYTGGEWAFVQFPRFIPDTDSWYPCPELGSPRSSLTPKRGFGKLLCTFPDIRIWLGNPTGPERGDVTSFVQHFDGGFLVHFQEFERSRWITIAFFYGEDQVSGQWQQQ